MGVKTLNSEFPYPDKTKTKKKLTKDTKQQNNLLYFLVNMGHHTLYVRNVKRVARWNRAEIQRIIIKVGL